MPTDTMTLDLGDSTIEHGPLHGRPLLLMTRMAGRGSGIWDRIWGHLAEHFTVATFDLPMPSSDGLDDPRAVFGDFSAIAARSADALGFDRFHMLGWNGGTHVALRAAHDHPDRVASLLLVNPFCELEDMRLIDLGIDIMAAMMTQPDRLLYAKYWFVSGLSRAFIENRFDEVEALAEARVRGDRFVHTDAQRTEKWARSLRRNWLARDELGALRAPALLVATGEDRWYAGPTVAMAQALHALIPRSEIATVPDYGSLLLWEAPERFMAVASSFITTVTARR